MKESNKNISDADFDKMQTILDSLNQRKEITDLKSALKQLLDASWNGPIDADHPARIHAANCLE